VDRAKIEVIKQLPPQANVKGIHSFWGHAGFYRRFIKNFSENCPSFDQTLSQGYPFHFDDEECLIALRTLNKALISAPIIQPPEWSLPFWDRVQC
jgi:hypothetical protein